PLLGYLFRSKSSNSQKRNLLIFVTARLVDPAGNPIRKEGVEDVASRATVDVSTRANP
ncbi:MAG: type II and III secretion system protein, partial [Lentisphaerae bacterium]|nr:type II and III secretion system protein [Lentisphaerota bacterium]